MTTTATDPAPDAATEYAPDAPAYVFIASMHSAPAKLRVLWKVTVAQAQAICSDDRTSLRNSMLVWTQHLSPEGQGKTWHYVADDGRFAPVLADLGITVAASKANPG